MTKLEAPGTMQREKVAIDEVSEGEDVAGGRDTDDGGGVEKLSEESVRWGQKGQQMSAVLYQKKFDNQRWTNDPHSPLSWG